MKQSEAWMLQVRSDLAAGQAVFAELDAATYCQAISKFQQVAEKLVKAMVAALDENGVSFVGVGKDHYPRQQIDALLLLKRAVSPSLLSHIKAIFSGPRLGEIRALCLLAPSLPPRRNTEYPYPDSAVSWTAPAAPGSFRVEEVYRFRSLANDLVPMIGRFVQAANRSLR